MFKGSDFDDLLAAFCLANFWEPEQKVDLQELAEAVASRANRLLREAKAREISEAEKVLKQVFGEG